MTTLLLVIVAIVLVKATWYLRGRHELRKTTEYQQQQAKIRESAKWALEWLRSLNNQPLGDRIPKNIEYSECFYNLRGIEKKGELKQIGTTANELTQLRHFYDIKKGWCKQMDSLETEYYSASSFEYDLQSRLEFLKENNKTLADFGITRDDTADLRKAFHKRLAKYVREKVLQEIKEIEKVLTEFKTDASTLPVKDYDFGLSEVRRRLDNLLTLQ